jgi:acyl-CoA synthetase (AMP-forming)/AMP-acid ligase II
MGDRKLTFDELNRAANRVAHGIIGQAWISNSTILLLFPQGVDVITAILAVLKAGKMLCACGYVMASRAARRNSRRFTG